MVTRTVLDSYLHMKKAIDVNKAGKLRDQLHLLSETPAGQHTLFLDNEADLKAFNAADHFDTIPELAGRTFNRPRKAAIEANEVIVQGPSDMKQVRAQYEPIGLIACMHRAPTPINHSDCRRVPFVAGWVGG